MPAKSQPRRGQPRARTAERHTYRPSAALRGVALSLIVLFGALAVVFAYFSTRSLLSTVFCALPIVLFFLLAVSYISYLARRTSLVLAASGLEYHTPNLSLRTSWENVERLVDEPLAPRLVLSRPANVDLHTRSARVRAGDGPAAGRAVPLRLFGYTRGSQLDQDLRRFAPHLFASPERSPQ
ncbi:hypothetical protein [Kouleothrix sp.]|uniref:hypothetical protein n=1 Tax=Kouleothrix sp. TaxID=2779161 RepID=UPI00391B3ECA